MEKTVYRRADLVRLRKRPKSQALALDLPPALSASVARRIAEAYERWGRGTSPAALNFGDCFAYEVAKERGCPLLFVGADFALTDLESAL